MPPSLLALESNPSLAVNSRTASKETIASSDGNFNSLLNRLGKMPVQNILQRLKH